jgi:hypothetical protein
MRLLRETLDAGGPGVERVICLPIISRVRPRVFHDLRGQAQDMSAEVAESHLIVVFRS